MTKLTTLQLTVLSSACARDDALATRPINLRPAAATKLVASLFDKGFAKEIRAKPNAPVWREDEEGRYALKVLKTGRLAVEAQAGPAAAIESEASPIIAEQGNVSASDAASTLAPPRGAKRAKVITLLQRPEGAAMAELIKVTGWLPHTTRAALSGLRKAGMAVEFYRSTVAGSASVYRILPSSDATHVDNEPATAAA